MRPAEIALSSTAPTMPGVEAYRLSGSLFFGAVSKLEALTDPARFKSEAAPRVVILDFSGLLSLDTTGLETIESLRRQLG